MKPSFFELTYFETYYFANIINNLLRDPFSYLRSLNEFFGDENYKRFLDPFPKQSRFHDFIYHVIDSITYEDINDQEIELFRSRKRQLWIEIALDHFGFTYEKFDDWISQHDKTQEELTDDEIFEYLNELKHAGTYEDLLDRMSEEIFFILFLNRQVLQNFNQMAAHQIEDVTIDSLEPEEYIYFQKDGVLKRVSIPMWVQRAVLFRDRGMCVSCNKDLSGILSIGSIENFDHIVPLSKGGMNDITNIQLLCESCNKSKQGQSIDTSIKYEKWY